MTKRDIFEAWYKSKYTQYHKALQRYDGELDFYYNDYIQDKYFVWCEAIQESSRGAIEKLDQLNALIHTAEDLHSKETSTAVCKLLDDLGSVLREGDNND